MPSWLARKATTPSGHVGRGGQERPEKSHRSQLDCEAEPVMVAATGFDPITVIVAEHEVPHELGR
jgi:hypothetical protein